MTRLVGLALLLLIIPSLARATCTVTTSTVAFGPYNPTSSSPTDTTGTITVKADATGCGAYVIALGRSGTSYNPRVFTTGPTANVAFNLYVNTTRATIWGDGSAGTQAVTGPALGANGSQSYTVYGRIPSPKTASPGAYSASIVATSTTTSGTITPATQSFMATTSVAATCTISATALAFSAYAGLEIDATATITATCANATSYNVGLSAGNATGATVTTRKMQGNDVNGLAYALFSDTARTQNWGTTIGTDTVAGTGNGAAQSLTVNGRIAAGQTSSPGSYADTIVATITYGIYPLATSV